MFPMSIFRTGTLEPTNQRHFVELVVAIAILQAIQTVFLRDIFPSSLVQVVDDCIEAVVRVEES